MDLVRIPSNALVVLVGPSGSGKSTWAGRWFRPDQVVSSDGLRGLVGTGEHDQRAGTDAFDVLALAVERRMKRGLLTVIDSLGLDEKLRAQWVELARARGRPAVAVLMTGAAKEFRSRNKNRPHRVPSNVLSAQLTRWETVAPALNDQFDNVVAPGQPVIVPSPLLSAPPATERQADDPMALQFDLHIPRFDFAGGTEAIGPALTRLAVEAEAAGFRNLWVMDHLIQIPQVGRAWDPMLESYTTLGFLAGATERMGLGTMVTGVTYRNVGHLAKTIATLDVLSGGRARCGIGAAWFEKEHTAYGWDFPSNADRLDLLEEALQVLRLMWGPGAPSFDGKHLEIAEATCYPRPIQERVPVLVGGSGEKRTLKLAAAHADACNLFGEPEVIAHKVAVLADHCRTIERDPSEVEVTQLSNVLVAPNPDELDRRIAVLGSANTTAEDVLDRTMGGLVVDHIGRFRLLHEAGVDAVVVSLADVTHPGAIENFATVIDAFA